MYVEVGDGEPAVLALVRQQRREKRRRRLRRLGGVQLHVAEELYAHLSLERRLAIKAQMHAQPLLDCIAVARVDVDKENCHQTIAPLCHRRRWYYDESSPREARLALTPATSSRAILSAAAWNPMRFAYGADESE